MKAKSDFGRLLLLFGPMLLRIGLGLVCLSLSGLAATIGPLPMGNLIDSALPRRNLHWALGIAGGIAVCYFARSSLSALGLLVTFSIAQRCVHNLRFALLDQLNRLSADYHEHASTGERLTRIEHDVDETADLGAVCKTRKSQSGRKVSNRRLSLPEWCSTSRTGIFKKQCVCQFRIVSKEECTPNDCAHFCAHPTSK